jgi:hypothetical protein
VAQFNRDAMRRIGKQTRLAELLPKGGDKPPDGQKASQPLRNALVTAAISARSGSTKGQGTVTLYVDTNAGTGAQRVLQAGVKCRNIYGSPINAGKWIVVGIVDGEFQVLGGDC